MVGIVIVAHGRLGEALIEATEFILEDSCEATVAVSIDVIEGTEMLRDRINTGIKRVDQGDGVLVLTDMFGGTPSNLSLSFLEEGRIEVITGVNLPILVRAASLRKKMELKELAQSVQSYGKKSIYLASDILKGNKRA
nr:PTS fructose transporter subunit IIA [Desulfobacterales bacterium]